MSVPIDWIEHPTRRAVGIMSVWTLSSLTTHGSHTPFAAGWGPLVAIGGIHVPAAQVGGLERSLSRLCASYGFPDGEEFKWSPGKGHWMRENLTDASRAGFYVKTLEIAADCGARAVVVVSDTNANKATGARSHELDVTTMFIERMDAELGKAGAEGFVIVDQPSGNRQSETKFLADCVDVLRTGTKYRKPVNIPLSITSAHSELHRPLQLADVVTGCVTAMVAGHEKYAKAPFDVVRDMLYGDSDHKGGRGLKIHPDLWYGNLYGWLLGDMYFHKRGAGWGFPLRSLPYNVDPMYR